MVERRPRSRSRSRYSLGGSYDDPYAYDDALYRRRRSHSRHHSRSRSRPIQIGNPGGEYPIPMSGVGFPNSGYAHSMPSGVASSYGGHSSSYGSFGGGGNMPMPIHGTPYPQSAVPMPVHGSSYQGPPMGIPPRTRSASISYGQDPYMGQAMSNGGGGGMMIPGVPPQQTTVILKPHRRHRHHHHSSRSKRSRSIEPYVDHYPRY